MAGTENALGRRQSTVEEKDEEELAEFGYKQELRRDWGLMHNFGISFSIIVGFLNSSEASLANGPRSQLSLVSRLSFNMVLPLAGLEVCRVHNVQLNRKLTATSHVRGLDCRIRLHNVRRSRNGRNCVCNPNCWRPILLVCNSRAREAFCLRSLDNWLVYPPTLHS